MLRIAAILWILLPTGPALAMNWEGHEGYMEGFPPGEELRKAIPEARPLPSPDCPVTPEMVERNPYEQIPLPRHRCPPREKQPQPEG